MANALVDFWKQYRLDRPPFVHPEDVETLSNTGRIIENDAVDFDSYVTGKRFEKRDDGLHLSLLPVPYIGNLEKSQIVVLLLNPGFDHSDYWAESKRPEFRKRLEQNLYQSFDEIEFPFIYLDPQFCWHSGFRWWERKLREVTQRIALSAFDGNYRDALRDLSQRLACVELFPYHSASFTDNKLIGKLPSTRKTQSFVQDSIRGETDGSGRIWIATRKARDWGCYEKQDCTRLCRRTHKRRKFRPRIGGRESHLAAVWHRLKVVSLPFACFNPFPKDGFSWIMEEEERVPDRLDSQQHNFRNRAAGAPSPASRRVRSDPKHVACQPRWLAKLERK